MMPKMPGHPACRGYTMFDAEASIGYTPHDARASDAYAFFAVFLGFDA